MTKSKKSETVKTSLFKFGGNIKAKFKNVGEKIGNQFDKKKREKNQNVDIMQYEAQLDTLYEKTADNREPELANEELRNNYKEFQEFKKF